MTRAPRLPSTLAATVHFTEAESVRVRTIIAAHGHRRARQLIGVSDGVFDAARDCGRVRATTRDRIVKRMDELEATKGATT